MLNLSRYLPALEDYPIDVPQNNPAALPMVPQMPMAHEQGGAALQGVAAAEPVVAEQPAIQVEIPEASAPEMIASSDEAQAANNEVDGAHDAAATDSAAAIAADAQKLEGADVAPGQDSPAAEEGDAAAAGDIGGDLDAVPSEGGETGLDDLGAEPVVEDELAEGDVDAALGGDAAPAAGEEPVVEEAPITEDEEAPVVEEEPVVEEAAPEGEEPLVEEAPEGEEPPAEEDPVVEEETEEEEEEILSDGFDEDEDAPDMEEGELDVPDVDTEVTEEEIADSEDEAGEAKAEDDEVQEEIVDTNKTIAELKKEEAAVEKFIGILQHGIRNKQHSPQFLAVAQDKLGELSRAFGQHSPTIPSMENYTQHNLEDYYTNSLESFVGFQRRITHMGKKLIDKVAKGLNESMHINAVSKEIATLNKRADKLLVGLKDVAADYVLTVTKPPMPLRTSKVLVTAVADEIKALTEIGGKVFKADAAFIKGLIDIANEATKEADSTKSIQLANKALKLPLAEKSYPASAFSGALFGGWKLVKSDKKATGDLLGDMKSLADRSIPDGGSEYYEKIAGDITLKKADLIKLMQFAKVLIGVSNSCKASVGRTLMESLNTANTTTSARHLEVKQGDKEQVKKAEKAMDQLTSVLWDSVGRSLDNYGLFQWHICIIVDSINALVGRAVK